MLCVDRVLASAEHTTSVGEIDAAVGSAITRHGGIDILQNNVGTAEPGGPENIDEACWDRVMSVNLKGLFLTCKRIFPMVRQGSGAIVNVSLVASITTTCVPMISYYSSKAGVNHFTRAVAVEYAPKGTAATPFFQA